MPKEKISDNVGVDTIISWGDDHVQVATIVSGTEGSTDSANGWYTTLDEEGITRIIRALKRARRRVYL